MRSEDPISMLLFPEVILLLLVVSQMPGPCAHVPRHSQDGGSDCTKSLAVLQTL